MISTFSLAPVATRFADFVGIEFALMKMGFVLHVERNLLEDVPHHHEGIKNRESWDKGNRRSNAGEKHLDSRNDGEG